MNVRSPLDLWLAAAFALVAAAHLLRGKDTDTGWVFLVLAVASVAAAFLRTSRAVEIREPLGPGPLARTPAGRFRGSGWPPSKDVDDYR